MPATRNRLVVIGAAFALALSACGNESGSVQVRTVTEVVTASPAATGSPAATPTRTAIQEATETVRLEAFRTPSGNIGCAMIGRIARCDIRSRDWSPPSPPENCEVSYGQGTSVQPDSVKGVLVCAGDTTLDPSARVLPYGSSSKVGRLTCVSRFRGVECHNDLGHGFEISREAYRTF